MEFAVIFEKAQKIFEKLDVEFKSSSSGKLTYRPNELFENIEEFFRISIFVSYLECTSFSMKNRFSSTLQKGIFAYEALPREYEKVKQIYISYSKGCAHNFIAEATTWYDMLKINETMRL